MSRLFLLRVTILLGLVAGNVWLWSPVSAAAMYDEPWGKCYYNSAGVYACDGTGSECHNDEQCAES